MMLYCGLFSLVYYIYTSLKYIKSLSKTVSIINNPIILLKNGYLHITLLSIISILCLEKLVFFDVFCTCSSFLGLFRSGRAYLWTFVI